ncbi:MAG TPA: exodeoxyribonuclease V subunit alpha [Rudaea sp.]|nr:exodeoxyribonuclease V subunit alpha [Rudaea sp.]
MSLSTDRAVDHTFAAWVRKRTGSDVLARAAFSVCRDEGLGHSCAALRDGEFDGGDFDALRGHAWVGEGDAFTPFVLRSNGDLYTWRNWRHESELARALRERARAARRVDTSLLPPTIEALFANSDARDTASQRDAVAASVGKRVFVLTGGPGTGKTSTALRMLLMQLRHADLCGFAKTPSIALAAPTGKAVQRLAQSIAAGKTTLTKALPSDSPLHALLDQVPHGRAQTLHRLLGFRPRENTFARSASSPISADIVLVDETSMVDLATMRQLFDAVRPDATLILLGDPGQLYAIEAGSVLGDIVGSADAADAPLADHVVTLDHVWRAGQGLDESLRALRRGDMEWTERLLHDGDVGNVRWRHAAIEACVETWIDDHAATFDTLMRPGAEPADALAALRTLQILCALHRTPNGSLNINALVTRRLGRRLGIDTTTEWHHGRPVIIARNDYARDLYNGDVGIALHGADGLRVWFETRDRDGVAALRSLSARTLPAHETAWAITIHRSQGSEYDDVAVVLPTQDDHRILSRELIYTAMSRASRRVELWTSSESLRTAVARPVRRRGGLRDRLR